MKGKVKDVSNLGGYQKLTTYAKRVGGPRNLVLIIASTGAVLYKGSELLIKKVVRVVKNKHKLKKVANSGINMYAVKAYGVSNEGLEFNIDDRFKVLELDGDTVLIEKIGDNNPYFVSVDLLKIISDYKN